MRLDDFVNEEVIKKIIVSVGQTCTDLRGTYVDLQEDLPEGWTITSTLSMIGLGAIAGGPKKAAAPVVDPEAAKELFAKL